jgi:hypothetical protein
MTSIVGDSGSDDIQSCIELKIARTTFTQVEKLAVFQDKPRPPNNAKKAIRAKFKLRLGASRFAKPIGKVSAPSILSRIHRHRMGIVT